MTRVISKCKYLSYWEYSQRYTKSNILRCASKNIFFSFSWWAHRLPNNVRLICNNITDNRQKSVSACICALLSLPLWHIIKFSPMTPLIMAVLISYVMYYTHTHKLYIHLYLYLFNARHYQALQFHNCI